MKRIHAVICLAAVMISLFTLARTERTGPYSDMTVYGTGKYEVGESLSAGEYILFSLPFSTGFFAVSTDEDGMEVISEGTFDANTILRVEEGDCLEMNDCIAIYAEEYYSMHRISLNQSGGMYKVGVDVRPGVCKLDGQAGKKAVYRIYNDSRLRLAVEEKEFLLSCKVRLEENQYLELINCSINADFLKPTATPEPSPTPDPEPTTAPMPTDIPEASSQPEQPDAKPTRTPKPAAVLSTVTPDPLTTASPAPTEKPASTPTVKPTVTPSPEKTLEPEPTATPKVTRKVRIGQDRSPIIRSLPSTKGEKIGMAEAGRVYEMLEVEDKWYKIRLDDGTEGWITTGMAEIVE